MTRAFFRIGSASILLGAAFLASSCFDSTQKEEVELTLTNVRIGVDSIRITLVDFNDTSIVYETLWDDVTIPSSPFRASIGSARGHDWLVKVEGFQNGYLVYHVLIPSDVTNVPLQLDVRDGWPGITFTATRRDTVAGGDSVTFYTKRRRAPANTHWHLNYGVTGYVVVFGDSVKIAASDLPIGTWVNADIRLVDHSLMSVQAPDTMLADEALNPAGSSVQIIDAFLDTRDTVNLMLSLRNFQAPLRDEPTPGRGSPMVHDKRGLRLIPEFHLVTGSLTHLVGPSWALSGVDTLVVALHYNSPLGSSSTFRIRPTVADTMPAVDALRLATSRPSLRILSHTYNTLADTLYLNLERMNYTGYHTHIFRNTFGDANYQVCNTDQCAVVAGLWQGASAVVVAVYDANHVVYSPVVKDSISLP